MVRTRFIPLLQARRLPSRSQARRVPSRRSPSAVTNTDNAPAAALHRPPIPGRDAPIRHATLGLDRGLHKYTTGLFPPIPGKSPPFMASFKLWSRGPLPGPPLGHIERLKTCFRADPTAYMPDATVQRAFEYLYDVATEPLTAHENVESVFAQMVVRPSIGEGIYHTTPSGKSILMRQRSWSICCSTERTTTVPGGLTRPEFLLQSEANNYCGYLRTRDTRHPPALTWTLRGFLKPDVAPQRVQNASGTLIGELQSTMDVHFRAILATVYKQRFLTVRDLVTAVRLTLQALLPVSAIPKALDMHCLELACVSEGGARYVDAVLLNDDGTVKNIQPHDDDLFEATSDSLAAETPESSNPARMASSQRPPRLLPPPSTQFWPMQSSLTQSPLTSLSRLAHNKLGFGPNPTYRVWVAKDGQHLSDNPPEWTQVLENFDLACRTSTFSGLACWSHALVETSRSLASHITFGILKRIDSNRRYLFVCAEMQKCGPRVELRFRKYINLNCQQHRSLQKYGTSTASYIVALHGRIGALPSKDRLLHNIRTGDEMRFLIEVFRSVISRICGGMDFTHREARLRALAEALLRVVDFRTSSIQLTTVFITETIGLQKGRAEATWKNNDGPVPQGLAKEQADCVVNYTSVDRDRNKGLDSDDVDDGPDLTTGTTLEALESTPQSPGYMPDDSRSRYNPAPMGELDSVLRDEGADEPSKIVSRTFERDGEELADMSGEGESGSDDFIAYRPGRSPGYPGLVSDGGTFRKYRDSLIFTTRIDNRRELSEQTARKIGASSLDLSLFYIGPHPTAHQQKELHETAKTNFQQEILLRKRAGIQCLLEAAEFGSRQHLHPATSITATSEQGTFIVQSGIFSRSPMKITTWTFKLPAIHLPYEILEKAPSCEKKPAGTVGLKFSISANDLSFKDSADLGVSSVLTQIANAIIEIVTPVIRLQTTLSTRHIAAACAAAILRSSQPLAGFLPVAGVEVSACKTDVHGKRGAYENVTRHSMHYETGQDVDMDRFPNDVCVALGSNVGDRFQAIESACRMMEECREILLYETSSLFETKPMYVEDQEPFLNGVCRLLTSLEPIELLDKLQSFEKALGRVKLVDKGPRNIDLDIISYNRERIDTERLTVPHPLMLEREFVLRPLCDSGMRNWTHPATGQNISSHLKALPPSESPMDTLTPLGPDCDPIRTRDPKRRTHVMSILNVTPDSFSDGGVNQATDIGALKATISSHIASGATIIDVGGQSSRPNAPDITAEEEIARILPAIEAIKSLPEAKSIAISVDTYRASVAEAAISAGAHLINDISAGLLDPEMLPTIARLGCTYIMMHMRGTPATMQNEENTSYPRGLLPTIAIELCARYRAARIAGIRRWRIILDPGLGFAKTVEQNVELLRKFSELRNERGLESLPWLVGSSRKGFIGKITGVAEARDRIGGTAATVTAAIQGGAEIVRVHDVEEMVQVVKMADEMYRSG